MNAHLHLVFSRPPEGLPDAEYERWYAAHLDEILSVPGWAAAQRYRLDREAAGERALPYRYLSLYELDRPPDEAVAALERAGLGSADSYEELKADDEGRLPLPAWFGDVVFASWNATAIGEPDLAPAADDVAGGGPPSVWLVFSGPPDGVAREDYDTWYDGHTAENIESPGFLDARRYAVEPVVTADDMGPHQRLALYHYAGDGVSLRTHLLGRVDSGEIVLPAFFPEIRFGVWMGSPIGDRAEAPVS